MKLTAQIKLRPTKEQKEILLETLEVCNRACDYISGVAFEKSVYSKFKLQTIVYTDVKEKFKLSAQIVIRCIGKVCDSYKIDKMVKRRFRKSGAIPYDSRILSYRPDKVMVSIWSIEGRLKISFVCGEHQRKLLEFQQGESDLAYHKGKFYLLATCDVQDDDPIDFDKFIGVDLGIVNIATTNSGESFSGDAVEKVRQRFLSLRGRLQKCGSKSAKRHLKKISKLEKNFRKDTNHKIAYWLVRKAKALVAAIVLEDLKELTRNSRKKRTVRKKQRAKLSSWAFYQLRQFIEYKAKRFGIPVILVDPKNTSRECSACGHIDKRNRKSQSEFVCCKCNHNENADVNAAKNLVVRAACLPAYCNA